MRITSKGQVTIPIEIREQVGLLPGSEVEFIREGETVRIVRAESKGESRGQRIVRALRGRATIRDMTTDEIMALMRGE